MGTVAAPATILELIPSIVAAANKLAPCGAFQWSILGHSWGGKIACLAAGKDNKLFTSAVQCSPAWLTPEEAKSVSVPMALLASKDEAAEDVEAFRANLPVAHHIEQFHAQVHGWMSVQSDFGNEEVRKEYARGYQIVLEFFHKYA